MVPRQPASEFFRSIGCESDILLLLLFFYRRRVPVGDSLDVACRAQSCTGICAHVARPNRVRAAANEIRFVIVVALLLLLLQIKVTS